MGIVLGGPFPYQVQAGQFINILINQGKDHILRRPISIAEAILIKKFNYSFSVVDRNRMVKSCQVEIN